jgi:signal transduction histidine kinase
MKAAVLPPDEQERLHELYKYDLLDTSNESDFDEIVQLASRICKVPISLISLIDADRQWFKAKVGVDLSETTRDESICSHAILQDEMLEINDMQQDTRFSQASLLLDGDPIRFYAGVPLVTERGYKLGTLCVIDNKAPHTLDEEQVFALKVLARQVIKLIELRSRNKELQHLIGTQNRITSIIAHDVRNPLAALKAIIELKTSGMLTEDETTEMLTMSAKQLDSTLDMVANVVDWGKLQMKIKKLQKQPVNVHEQAALVLNSYNLSATLKHNQLLNKVPEDMILQTDAQALQFVLRNLLSNANKFTEHGSITIQAHEIHDRIELQICDTGIGIAQGKINNLFDTQKNNSTPGTQNEKGSGLGLLLIKEFLDKINGRIHIQSEEGSGTCVTIIF